MKRSNRTKYSADTSLWWFVLVFVCLVFFVTEHVRFYPEKVVKFLSLTSQDVLARPAA